MGLAETPTGGCTADLTLPAHLLALLKNPADAKVERAMAPIAPAEAPTDVEASLRQNARVLVEARPENPDKGLIVFLARGREIQVAMRELGRAREESFRDVGEGSGEARDLDHFDDYYLQLVCWDKRDKQITGAYRLGMADEILREQGISGLYSNSLFHFSPELVREFSSNTLELGRTFVRPKYRGGLTLHMLWKGIAQFLVENPRYHHLIGPVSISGDLNTQSRQIMSEFMMRHFPHPRSGEVQPRTPPEFKTRLTREDLALLMSHLTSIDQLQQVVRVAEDDEKLRLPPLFKIYLQLDVQFMTFNEDKGFNTLDGLIWTDLSKLDFETHKEYMGEEGARVYRAGKGLASPP